MVEFGGEKVRYVDGERGEIVKVEVFVGWMG